MSQTRTYDPAKNIFSFLGNLIASGYAKGTFIKVTRNSDSFTLDKGPAGDGVRSKTNDKSAIVELTLQATSQANDVLSALAVADELSASAIGPLFIKETNGTMKCAAENAWIKKQPDLERAEASGSTTWIFECDSLEMFAGGLT